MALNSYEDLNSMQIDTLREIGNIGSGNAATALSGMIGVPTDINLPVVSVLGFNEAVESIGDPEDVIGAVLFELIGEINGIVMLLINKDFSDKIISTFFGEPDNNLLELDENKISALSETGNILAGAYISAIAGMTMLEVEISTPSFAVDMLGAILSVPISQMAEVGDKLLLIQNSLEIEGTVYPSNTLLIPTVSGLSTLLERLGVL